jgi:RNase P subunit RPR2
MSIAHISTTEEIMEGVNTEIEDEDDPIVFLTCPNCGKKHQIPKSELLAMEVVYGDEAD